MSAGDPANGDLLVVPTGFPSVGAPIEPPDAIVPLDPPTDTFCIVPASCDWPADCICGFLLVTALIARSAADPAALERTAAPALVPAKAATLAPADPNNAGIAANAGNNSCKFCLSSSRKVLKVFNAICDPIYLLLCLICDGVF